MQGQRFGAPGTASALHCLLLLGLLLLLAGCGMRPTPGAPVGDALRIENPFARPAAMGQNGAAYFTIINPTDTDDILAAVSGRVAAAVEIHETRNDKGVLRMVHHPDGVSVPARSVVPFAPGGSHVMLMDLRQPLEAGQSFTLTLTFANAGEVEIGVRIQDK